MSTSLQLYLIPAAGLRDRPLGSHQPAEKHEGSPHRPEATLPWIANIQDE